ncbi:long-chain-fatty-acid--CoA ligase 1-like [Paramacrobiotus metropolitanus]|uniref:long-chain-fatty-acid--CoA ligase 1-like n=1 Tax=Paramacrobiotus metropolitanus TaxID=2943436 RepID=UPI002445F977|nr:long-chain-fatty-acid--CoA ligase 1-like [Paramacrobiotus metropolitanus]
MILSYLYHILKSLIYIATNILEKWVYRLEAAILSRKKNNLLEIDGQIRRRRSPSQVEEHLRMVFPENLYDVLLFGKQLSDNGPCIGYRPTKDAPYVYLSYDDAIQRATAFGSGLLELGGRTHGDFFVGIFAKTSLEWTVAEYGCLAYGMVTAPLYDSLGHETCLQMIEFYGIEMLLCDGDTQLKALLGDSGQFPVTLRTIITIESLPQERVDEIKQHGVDMFTMDQVEELGRANLRPVQPGQPDDMATLIFTSGTTGVAKGVMITHREFLENIRHLLQSFLPLRLGPDDCMLGFLPLAHIFERFVEKIIHLHGGRVGYISENVNKSLFQDARDVQPTVFVFVPRLMTRLYDQIQLDISGFLRKIVVAKLGLIIKRWDMQRGVSRTDSMWDRLLFKEYQKLLGGHIRIGMIGAAPTDGKILNFMRGVFGAYIFEVYGQTEATGVITTTTFGDMSTDHVGIPMSGVEMKLADVPELGYYAKDGKGEVCCRADFIMSGYFNMPEKTAETVDKEAWLHTGDIGMWLPNGNLKIFDRKKHIFKLSQGEYLAPDRLESIYLRSELIVNIFIDGNGQFPFCVALVYPNYDALDAAESDGCADPSDADIKQRIIDELTRVAKEAQLRSYEIPKNIHLLDEPFSVENGCITPSQKTQRDSVRVRYRDQIAALYTAMERKNSATVQRER